MDEAYPPPSFSPLALTVAGAGAGAQIARARDDRRFRLILALTFFVHASMLIGFNAAEPRRLGAEGGAEEAISVSIITEADLRGNATVEDFAAGRPAPAVPAPAATPPPQTQAQPELKPSQQPTEDAAQKTPPPVEPAEKTEAEPPAEASKPVEEIAPTPELLALPDPSQIPAPKAGDAKPSASKGTAEKDNAEEAKKPDAAEKSVAKPQPPAKQPPAQKTAKLDLTPPAVFQAPVGGGGAGVQRPAGITRSGENDDFARGVIRALQTTMPQLRDTRGRVTVRITLSMQGDLVSTEVLKPSTVAGLDQSVVFATRQSSFPFPPHNAKPVDLVFIVTYIYR